MAWKETDPVQERQKFIQFYRSGRYSVSMLCELFGISRKTAYKFIARYEEGGEPALVDRSHAAHSHPNATSSEIVERIIAAKHERPRWGPEKLIAYLSTQEPEVVWPAVSTAGAILKRAELVKPRRKRRAITHPGRPKIEPITAPNQLHNLDYKGQFRTRDGRWCYPLTLTDSYSRALLLCEGFLSPSYENTQRALKRCFREYGLPAAIRFDNGEPFVGARSLAGLSRLGVWFIKLGIDRIRTRPGSPQDNGLHERMHLTLKQETAFPPADGLSGQQSRFNYFQHDYNEVRPHQALDGRTPASLYSPSPRPFPKRLPSIEYDGHLEVRSVRTNGSIKWKGKFLHVSEALHGERVGLEETDCGIWSVYFGTLIIGILDEREGTIIG